MVNVLTYWDVHKQIKSGKLSPVYLFTGEELFLKKEIEGLIQHVIFKGKASDLDHNIFYAQDSSLDDVLGTLKTQPFAVEQRLVVLRDVEKFSQHEKKLIEFFSSGLSRKAVFIIETGKRHTDKFIKKIAEFCTVAAFSELEEKELYKWINTFARKHDKQISSPGIALLVEKLGCELEGIVNALSKLFLYCAGKKAISEADVELLIKKTRQNTRFAFLNALMRRQTGRALIMANELSRGGKHATDLIGLINWQLKRMENVKKVSQPGAPKAEMLRKLKMTPYVFNIIRKQAQNFSIHEIEKNFKLLLESDMAIKQGTKSPGLALETLIVDICMRK